jgi:hypothetical protein
LLEKERAAAKEITSSGYANKTKPWRFKLQY